MKKILLSFLIFILLCGCKNKYIVCKIGVNNEEMKYINTGTYKIYYKKTFVNKIEKYEVYESNDRHVLDYFEEGKDIEIKSLNEKYGGYSYTIKRKNKKVFVDTVITLDETDIAEMIKDKYLSKYYVKNNKLTLGGIKLFYETKGAICD